MDKSQVAPGLAIGLIVIAVVAVVFLFGRQLMPRGKVHLSPEQIQKMQQAMGQHGNTSAPRMGVPMGEQQGAPAGR